MVDIFKEAEGAYRFRVMSQSGQVVFHSSVFPDKQKIRSVIKSYSGLLTKPGVVERRTDHQGKFLFCLKNKEGSVVGKSTLYESEAGMENAIKNFQILLFTK